MLETNAHVDFRYVFIELIIIASVIWTMWHDKKYKTHYTVNLFLYSFWVIAILFVLYVYGTLDPAHPESVSAFTPLGMIIAAMLASLSVMKNIAETKAHDIAKSKKEKKRKRIFAYKIVQTIRITMEAYNDNVKDYSENTICEDIKSNLETIKNLINTIFCDSVFPYLSDDEQKILSDLYNHVYSNISAFRRITNLPQQSSFPNFTNNIEYTYLPSNFNNKNYTNTSIKIANEYITLYEKSLKDQNE